MGPKPTRIGPALCLIPQTLFANLAEKEKIKGHHSPEGRAIHTLARAMMGWHSGALSGEDAFVLGLQAMGDWLKDGLGVSAWSQERFVPLVLNAKKSGLINGMEAYRLLKMSVTRMRLRRGGRLTTRTLLSMMQYCVRLLDQRW